MANEMQKVGEAASALPVDGADGPTNERATQMTREPASVGLPGRGAGGKQPYSPPRLRSLGKVAELTFGNTQGSKSDGLRRRRG